MLLNLQQQKTFQVFQIVFASPFIWNQGQESDNWKLKRKSEHKQNKR